MKSEPIYAANRLHCSASSAVLTVLSLVASAGVGSAQTDPIDPEIIVAAETGLRGADGPLSIPDAMAECGLSGLSVAVIEDYRIAWTRTYGVKEAGGDDAIDRETAFSTASISKAVTGTLAAILVEKGKLDLDVPVGDYLERWQLPENEHTAAVTITLRHLLSHTAGTTQHGFEDHYLGDEIPTLAQVLDGEAPATTEPLQVDLRPGTEWRYSGGGFVIAQMAIEDQLGSSLADLAQEHLFTPLGMTRTTMKQPGEEGFLTNVAKAHDEDGQVIRTGLPICPQLAPSGMWSTPSDLAVFLIEIQNALRGHETKVISPAVAKLVTTEIAGDFGLGFALIARIHGEWQSGWFGHGGANTGTGGDMAASLAGGRGFVFFANGPNDIRMPLLEQLTDSIVSAHGWKVGE